MQVGTLVFYLYNGEGSLGFRIGHDFESQLSHLLAMRPRTSHFSFLRLGFLLCKIGAIISFLSITSCSIILCPHSMRPFLGQLAPFIDEEGT